MTASTLIPFAAILLLSFTGGLVLGHAIGGLL